MMHISPKYNCYTTCKTSFHFELNHTPNSLLFILTVHCMFRASIQLPFHTLTFWSHLIVDPTCILLPPRTATPPESSLFKKIIAALATRYNTSAAHVQRICSAECVKTWGKVRRLDGGDTMHASGVVKPAQDSRDATFIRVWIRCLFSQCQAYT